jgi:hypothetical protein
MMDTGRGAGSLPRPVGVPPAEKMRRIQSAVSFRAKREISLWAGRRGDDRQSEIPRFARNDSEGLGMTLGWGFHA